jgi:hypothetical protein
MSKRYRTYRLALYSALVSLVAAGLAVLVSGPTPSAVASASEHTATLTPSHVREASEWGGGGLFADSTCTDLGSAVVGYSHFVISRPIVVDDYHNCVHELAVRFDMGEIHQHAGAVVTRAELRYDEQPIDALDPDGHDTDPASVGGDQSQGYESCVWLIWVPSQNWTAWGEYHRGLVPSDDDPLITRLGTTRWDVTNQASHWYFGGQQDPDQNFGLVLTGYDEWLGYSNNAACLSDVSNLKLVVTYVADDPAPPPPTPTPNLAQRTGQAGRSGAVPGLNVQSAALPPPPEPPPAPAPALASAPAPADLRVTKLQLARKASPTCVAGPNQVTVAVQNSGGTDPGGFTVALEVDGKVVQQATAGGIGPGSEKTSVFSDITLGRGTHTLRAIVDPDHTVTPANDENHTRAVQVTCARP